ncbi:MAG: asparagine synthase (glutamine-hydrolyzing) [Terriglobales bacterium]
MCGICGIFHRDARRLVEQSALADMSAQIVHRGPDEDGSYVDGNVALAIRRLSIIDVQSGQQPIRNEDQNLWIVYNGEIYNHQQLRKELESHGHRYRTKSDTETIVHLYEEYGSECVQRLRGMFAFAIWNRRTRRLFIARDRLGIKPLYYRLEGGTLLFGSEIKAILKYPEVKPEFNPGVLAEYLAFGYIAGPETMFSGIRKLLPGHTLEIGETGEMKISQYWDLTTPRDANEHSRDYYVNGYRDLLEESVASHLMSDVPLGVFLSGGLDSSVVAALTQKIRREPIETFSVGYSEESFSELPYARQVADHLGSEHHETRMSCRDFFDVLPALVWHEDEPMAWPSSVSLYFVARLAKSRVTVVLTGEGSDETLGGYARYAWTLMNSSMDHVYRALTPAGLRKLLRSGLRASPLSAAMRRKLEHTFLLRDGEAWSSLYFDNFYSAFSAEEQRDLLASLAQGTAGDAYANSLRYWNQSSGDLLHRMLYTDIKTYLVELLMKQDQMSMAASIESRVPFLDHQLVEFTAEIPARYSIRGRDGKSILKSVAEDLLPRSVIDRKKMGFPTPWSRWLRAQLDGLEAMLLEPRTLNRGIFRRDAIECLFAEHRAGRRDHGDRIWRLLNLEIWHRVFIDGERPAGPDVVLAAALSGPAGGAVEP